MSLVLIEFGYKPDKPDGRDFDFQQLKPLLKNFGGIGDFYVIPSNRQKIQLGPSCAGNAGTCALEILSDVAGAPVAPLSAQFAWWGARKIDGTNDLIEGTYLRSILQFMTDDGVCLESSWENDAREFTNQPPARCFMEADDAKLKVDAYYRISGFSSDKPEQFEAAIRANHPVILGTIVGREFVQFHDEPGRVFDTPTDSEGGHAMLAVAVRGSGDSLEFGLLNWWKSPELVWVTRGFIENVIDAWVVTKTF